MKDSIYRISLDIHEHGSQAVLKAKKTDTGRKLHISLRAGGTPYTIEDDCYAVFKATKPDGSILYNACTIENNEIIYEFTEQTCTSVGRCRCEIALYGLDETLITSPRFALLVDGTIYPDERVESSEEFSALTKLVGDTFEVANYANEAAENANKAAVNATNTAKSLMVIGGAKGSVIALDNAIDQTLVGLRVFGKTTQDGTPTPDDPVELVSLESPTVGVYGKNLLTSYSDSTKTENGITFTVNGNGSITINGTATGSAQFNMVALYELTPAIRPGVSYIISGATSVAAIHIYEMKGSWVRVADTTSETTFVLSDDATGLLIRYVVQPNTALSNLTVYPMLRLASATDGTYEQGKSAQAIILDHTLPGIPVTSGGNYTDANGQQWVCDEIDFASGVYVQRVLRYSFTGMEYVYAPYWNNTGFTYSVASHGYPSPYKGSTVQLTLCNYLNNAGADLSAIAFEGLLYFRNIGSFADTQAAQAWLKECFDSGNPFSVIYPLDTPIETPLTEEELAAYAALHTYKAHTTVFNDAGAYMELEYAMDAKKYIDSLITGAIIPATVE